MKEIKFKSKVSMVEDQITRHFKDRNDNKLPSEDDLAQMMGVSRTTIRAALVRLEKKGIINKVKGSGSFFLNSVLNTKHRLNDFLDYITLIEEEGYSPSIVFTYKGKISQEEAPSQKLNCTNNEPFHRIELEYMADEKTAFLVDYYVPSHILHSIPPDKTYRGKAVHTNIFRDYANQNYSHYIAQLTVQNSIKVNRKFGISDETHLIVFEEYMYNFQDEAFSFSINFTNPQLFNFNMINVW